MKFLCTVCNTYVYDSGRGDTVTKMTPGTLPKDFPDTWTCPVCGATKDKMVEISEEEYMKKSAEYMKIEKDTTKEKKGILIGADVPGPQELREEYGKPLGLRGIGLGLSYQNNLKALEKYKLKTKLITSHRNPQTETTFFGTKIAMPILGAPMSGMSFVSPISEEDFAFTILEGCRLADTIGFTGNTSKDYDIHPGIAAVKKSRGVNIFKPQSQEVLIDLIKQSEAAGALAVGVDLDGAGSVNFTLAGKPLFRKTIEEIKELKRSTKLPFIVKGIMCKEDALAAVEAGVDAIGISNHGGRVLDSTPGVADVLPLIVKEVRKVNKKIVIMADGGVRTGFDALKMLALGADFVLVGRPLAREVPEGPEKIKELLDYFKTDLVKGMIMTSCNSLKDINEGILYKLD